MCFFAIYWFNPLIWLAYILLCRDIEAACDEKTIKAMNECERREYASTLLKYSVSRRMIITCPPAFGEIRVKERIKRIMDHKNHPFGLSSWQWSAARLLSFVS